tara:strand:+ start:487 stop:726 length:240 start_codon:yes stop_codon:yes gene_type:complete
LREKGVKFEYGKRTVVAVRDEDIQPIPKTPMMLLVEARTGQDIKVLIQSGKVRDIAKRLGVNYSTISKWRKMLGISNYD